MKALIILILVIAPFYAIASDSPSLRTEEQYREDSRQICFQDWSTRGELNRRMYDHCMEQQNEAYRDLVHLHQYATQSFYANTAFPYCRNEWTNRGVTNVRMKVHCLNQEVEGIRDVMYYREQHDEARVNAVVGEALRRFGSWRMAAYQVRRTFD